MENKYFKNNGIKRKLIILQFLVSTVVTTLVVMWLRPGRIFASHAHFGFVLQHSSTAYGVVWELMMNLSHWKLEWQTLKLKGGHPWKRGDGVVWELVLRSHWKLEW